MGTPAYMSPDQIYDLKDLDCRADIYSLGATIYHLLTGITLFPTYTHQQIVDAHIGASFARDPRALAPNTPEALALILNRMLAKDRKLRYPNWETLIADIQNLYAGKPLLATPLQPGESSVVFRP
jgi:serine/threonine-protein kinase